MFEKLKDNLKKYFLFFSLFFFGSVILFSLISFDPQDNSVYKFDSTFENYKNIFGYAGSLLSDTLFDIFGICSYLFALFLFLNGIRVVLGKSMKWYSWSCFPFFVILVCFFTNFSSDRLDFFNLEGGYLGKALFYYFETYFNDFSYYFYLLIGLVFLSLLSFVVVFNLSFNQLYRLIFFLKEFLFLIPRIFLKKKLSFNF